MYRGIPSFIIWNINGGRGMCTIELLWLSESNSLSFESVSFKHCVIRSHSGAIFSQNKAPCWQLLKFVFIFSMRSIILTLNCRSSYFHSQSTPGIFLSRYNKTSFIYYTNVNSIKIIIYIYIVNIKCLWVCYTDSMCYQLLSWRVFIRNAKSGELFSFRNFRIDSQLLILT